MRDFAERQLGIDWGAKLSIGDTHETGVQAYDVPKKRASLVELLRNDFGPDRITIYKHAMFSCDNENAHGNTYVGQSKGAMDNAR